jgi:polysaccharide pyruvyl transferase WcaK-like protein
LNTALITFHRAVNYGAVLQAYALQTAIKQCGTTADIIDYHCPYITSVYRPYDVSLQSSLTDKIKKYIKSPQLRKKGAAFEAFVKKNLVLTKSYNADNNLQALNNSYDCFLTGSDQVFNLDISGGDAHYLLDFADDGKKKCAYAASFGYDFVPPKYIEKTKKLLSRFDDLTVRESSGLNILQSLGIGNGAVAADPTLLLQAEQWDKIAALPADAPKKYVLVYAMDNCVYTLSKARQLAKIKGCKLVLVNPTLRQRLNCRDFKQYNAIAPDEFVGLFKNAEMVVTNSFHGTAFSIIYGVPFYSEASNKKKAARIIDLLDALNIKNRLLPNVTNDDMDWDEISANLNKLRETSLEKLRKMLK